MHIYMHTMYVYRYVHMPLYVHGMMEVREQPSDNLWESVLSFGV